MIASILPSYLQDKILNVNTCCILFTWWWLCFCQLIELRKIIDKYFLRTSCLPMISVLCGVVVDNEHADCQMTFAVMTPCFRLESYFFKSLFFSQSTLSIKWLMLALGPRLSLDCISSVMGFTAVVVQFVFKIFHCVFAFRLLVWPNGFQGNCTSVTWGLMKHKQYNWRYIQSERVRGVASISAGYIKTLCAVPPSWQTCLALPSLLLVCSFLLFNLYPLFCLFFQILNKSRKSTLWQEQKHQMLVCKL